jgi:hypothetical protein
MPPQPRMCGPADEDACIVVGAARIKRAMSELAVERDLDDAVAASFPASDPPSYWAGPDRSSVGSLHGQSSRVQRPSPG